MRYAVFDQIEITAPLGQLYRERLEVIRALDEAGFTVLLQVRAPHDPTRLDPQIGLLFAATSSVHEAHSPGLARLLAPVPPSPSARGGDLLARPHARRALRRRSGSRHQPARTRAVGPRQQPIAENYEEALAVLRATLTSDTLTFQGETYTFTDVPIMLRPLQQPMPPMWHPGNFQAAAKEGMNTIVVGPPPVIAEQVAKYQATCDAAGWAGGTVGGITSIIVAPTDDEALAIARRTWPVFTEHLTPLFRKWNLGPPGDPTLGGNVELALEVGALVAGSPSTIAERLAQFEEAAGTDLFVGKFTMGDLSHAELMRSIDLFASHVMKR